MITWDVNDHLMIERGAVLNIDPIADSFFVAIDATNDHKAVVDGRHEGALAD